MVGRPPWTDSNEAGDYVVPNVLSRRDLVSRPDIMDETVPHINSFKELFIFVCWTMCDQNNPKFATCSKWHNFMTY